MRSPSSIVMIFMFSAMLVWSAGAIFAASKPARSRLSPAPGRIKEIAAMLSHKPVGVGRPITDRQTWTAIGKVDKFERVVAEAEDKLGTPIPVVTQEDFDSYAKTGRRERYSRAFGPLAKRYRNAVYAECIENRGRFVQDIELAAKQLCKMPTWVPPYHMGMWQRDEDTPYIIDLTSSDIAAALATADYWLGDRISDSTRRLIRRELRRRIFDPFRTQVAGEPGRRIWWLTKTNNWNSVCMANILIAAQAVLPGRDDRAYFIAAAEKVIKYYLKGFSADGYCSEGLGYWNYGFSYYVMLADAVHQATDGKLDWMDDPHVRKMAMFGTRAEILPRVYPSIADAKPKVRPGGQLQDYIYRKYKLGLDRWGRPTAAAAMRSGSLQYSIFAFPHGLAATLPEGKFQLDPAREWFDDAQFYIGRPGGTASLAIACKGGHNAEHHNHNDVGTYLVAVGSETPLADPGAPVYTQRTFSGRRYEDKIINSWGHPVPLVAGKLQFTGPKAKATVLRRDFTDTQDTLVLDIAAAYDVPALKSLTRTFVYSRDDAGSLTVTDEVKFSKPESFGTALISYGDWSRNEDGSLSITKGDQSVIVTIDTDGQPYEIHDERIDSEVRAKRKPLRLGIDLSQPVKSARITVRITPMDAE